MAGGKLRTTFSDIGELFLTWQQPFFLQSSNVSYFEKLIPLLFIISVPHFTEITYHKNFSE